MGSFLNLLVLLGVVMVSACRGNQPTVTSTPTIPASLTPVPTVTETAVSFHSASLKFVEIICNTTRYIEIAKIR
ncbi:MAG: hypothetical protein GY805_21905 [Chloroflexi bacterium]|nr:hypothetical protein [Chloroflexota bacterium]